jgi:hypothetical protein
MEDIDDCPFVSEEYPGRDEKKKKIKKMKH